MAGTIIGTLEQIQTPDGRPKLAVIELLCTAAADDSSYPAKIINNLVDFDIRGLRLYSIATIPGDIGPTNDSDITITDKYDIDILADAGFNLIGNATKNRIVIGLTSSVIITGDITVNITANAVPSAVTTVILELIGL